MQNTSAGSVDYFMQTEEKELKHYGFGIKLILIGVGIVVGGILLVWMGLYPIRNSNRDELAIRFVKNNATIKTQVGEITAIEGFGLTERNRSREIAERLRKSNENPEKLKNVESNTDVPKVRLLTPEEAEWSSATLTGTLKTIEVQVRLREKEMGDTASEAKYYRIAGAKYRDENGDWRDIPIGWLENDWLLFK